MRWAAGLRAAAVAALVLALAAPQWQSAGRSVDVALLVDASDSLSGPARERARDWVRQALAAKGEDDRVAMALFGRDARLEYSLRAEGASAEAAVVVDPTATDLSRAVRLAHGVLGTANRRRAVLLTDGRETDGDVAAAAVELSDAGIALDVVLLEGAAPADVLVDRVQAPARLRRGEAYDVRVVLHHSGSTPAEGFLTLLAGGRDVDRRRVAVDPGDTEVVFRRTAQRSGTVRYEARLESGASTIAANDRGRAAVQVAGPPKVLLYQRRRAGRRPHPGLALRRRAGRPARREQRPSARTRRAAGLRRRGPRRRPRRGPRRPGDGRAGHLRP